MPSTPLIDPRAFYDGRTPSLLGAAVIVYLAGVTAVSTGAPFLGQVSKVEWSVPMVVFAVLVGGAIGGAAIWIGFTLIIYLLGALAIAPYYSARDDASSVDDTSRSG